MWLRPPPRHQDGTGESVQVDCPLGQLANIDGLIAALTVTSSAPEKLAGGGIGGSGGGAAAAKGPAPSGPTAAWDVAQVGAWLGSVAALKKWVGVFAVNEIVGDDFCSTHTGVRYFIFVSVCCRSKWLFGTTPTRYL
jgi:hypothetical protein